MQTEIMSSSVVIVVIVIKESLSPRFGFGPHAIANGSHDRKGSSVGRTAGVEGRPITTKLCLLPSWETPPTWQHQTLPKLAVHLGRL